MSDDDVQKSTCSRRQLCLTRQTKGLARITIESLPGKIPDHGCNVESTSLTLTQHRNNVVCKVGINASHGPNNIHCEHQLFPYLVKTSGHITKSLINYKHSPSRLCICLVTLVLVLLPKCLIYFVCLMYCILASINTAIEHSYWGLSVLCSGRRGEA